MGAKKTSQISLKTVGIIGVMVLAVVFTTYASLRNTAFNSSARTPVDDKSYLNKGYGSARSTLKDSQGTVLGSVKLVQVNDSVEVKVDIKQGLTPGFHGFHIHSVGLCDAPLFTTAGGHWGLVAGQVQPNHTGDLPSILVNNDGTAETDFTIDKFKLADLFDTDGSSFIVHSGRDNFANIPTRYVANPDTTTYNTGDAGSRAACGVIVRNQDSRD